MFLIFCTKHNSLSGESPLSAGYPKYRRGGTICWAAFWRPTQTLGTWHFLMLLVAMSARQSGSGWDLGPWMPPGTRPWPERSHSCRCRRADLQTMHMAVNTPLATWPKPRSTAVSAGQTSPRPAKQLLAGA